MSQAKAKFRIEGEDATGAAFRSALRGAAQAADGMSKTFKTAFAGISMASVAMVAFRGLSDAINRGDELAKAASKSGIASNAFTELAYAARMADVDVSGLSTALKKMQVALSTANSGGKTQISTLAALGLKIEDLRDLKADEQFEILADRISKLKDPADKARAATELFGRAGADLLPMFEQGAAGIEKLRKEAIAMGKSLSGEELARFQEADDAVKKLGESWDSLFDTFIIKAGPATAGFLNFTRAMLGGLTEAERLRIELEDLEKNYVKNFTGPQTGINANVQARYREVQRRLMELGELSSSGPTSRGRGGAVTALPPGFAGQAADEAAKAAAVAANKWREEWNKSIAQAKFEATLPVLPLEVDDQITVEESETFAHRMDLQLKDITKSFEESTDAWTTYVDQAARNMQDSLAQFLFDPFKDGLRGMLAGFVDMLRQMVAQLMASKIFEYLGGAMGGSSNPYVAALGSFFGGGKALGGPVSAGTPYMVGERGPELFMPGQSGSIVPNHKLGGGKVVNITTNVDARGATTDFIKQLPAILEASNRRAVQAARAAIYDDYSRGAFGRI